MAMRTSLAGLLAAGFLLAPFVPAGAFDLDDALRELTPRYQDAVRPDIRIAQNNGPSLSEAIDQVRRKTKGRIISAETRVDGNREVHYIKVLTKDGKVKTHKVPGRRLGNG
jgi:hypothetical protein